MAADMDRWFDLGVSYSTGRDGIAVDLVEAHKWFNLAAQGGDPRSAECRHDIACEMSRVEIAEAQRRARAFLSAARAA